MARSLEERLAALNALRTQPISDSSVTQLRKALGVKNNHVVALAAEIVGETVLPDLETDLAQAFARFMRNPAKTDKGCRAKRAIVEALYRLESRTEDVFLKGIRHVQMEPVYGGKEDTAAILRGASALGLVQMRYPDVMIELARLLADLIPDARTAAARAIADAGQAAGVPLLYFKVLSGDSQPQVIHECFAALLRLAPETSLPFVAGYLKADDAAVSESAALALGASRLPGAFPVLRAVWEETFDAEMRRAQLLGVAMLRHEDAIAFLLSLIVDGTRSEMEQALGALDMYRRDAAVWGRVARALQERDDG